VESDLLISMFHRQFINRVKYVFAINIIVIFLLNVVYRKFLHKVLCFLFYSIMALSVTIKL